MINNIIYALFLTLPPALWLLWKLPYWEAARDYAAIVANGAADNLHEAFHQGRALRRLGIVAAIGAAAALPLWGHWASWSALVGALVVGGLGWFFYEFNPTLSWLRGLPPYYVSADPRAAYFPDRLLHEHATSFITQLLGNDSPSLQKRITDYAGDLLRKLRYAILLTAAAVALLLAGAAWLVYAR
jgi:hypothetical protein